VVASNSDTKALLSVISMVLELMPNFADCFSQAGVKKMLLFPDMLPEG
jgi:hypothetical protein